MHKMMTPEGRALIEKMATALKTVQRNDPYDRVFLASKQQMHPTGLLLHDEDMAQIKNALTAANEWLRVNK